MPISVKHSGSWEEVNGIWVRNAGIWKPAAPFVKDAGEWKDLQGSAELTFHAGAQSGANQTSYNFALTVAGAVADRYLLAAVSGSVETSSTRAISGVSLSTFGALTSLGSSSYRSAFYDIRHVVGIYRIAIPTAVSNTFTVTFSGAMEGCSVALWTAIRLKSISAFHTNIGSLENGTPLASTLNIPDNGFLIGMASAARGFNAFTGATIVYEPSPHSVSQYAVAYQATGLSAQTARALSVTFDAAANGAGLMRSASFQ